MTSYGFGRGCIMRLKLLISLILVLLYSCTTAQKKVESGPNADLLRGAKIGSAQVVEQAILAGGDPQTRDERGRTPLHLACASGNLDTVKLLLQAKALVAVKKSRREGVAILNYLNNTGSKNYAWIGVSLPDAIQGLMAENFDFKRNQPEQTQKAADKIIGRNTEYSTDVFSQIGDKTKSAVIISGSYALDADPKNAVITTQVYNPVDGQMLGQSQITAPLDTNIFEALNQVAAEIVTKLKEYTSSEFAVRLKNSEQVLISDVNGRDKSDLTPLAVAGASGNGPIVDLLIKSGADYQTDLVEAINFGNEQTAVSIAAAAPDVSFRFAGGKTPLIQAAFKGRVQSVRSLLLRGAKKDMQDIFGFTALLYAAQEGHSIVVRDLLSAGANATLRTWDGFSALEAARRKGNTEIVEMLGKAGAK